MTNLYQLWSPNSWITTFLWCTCFKQKVISGTELGMVYSLGSARRYGSLESVWALGKDERCHLVRRKLSKTCVEVITSYLAAACHQILITETESGTRVVQGFVTIIHRYTDVSTSQLLSARILCHLILGLQRYFFSIYILSLFVVLKPHGDGGVATYAGLISWKHIVTNLHMGGRKLILTPLSRLHGQGRISVESPMSEQPYSGRALLTQFIGKVLEKVR